MRVGDRSGDLRLVAGRRFDAVVDTCGYVPADVRASSLRCRATRYLFVSSSSGSASFRHDAPLRRARVLASPGGIADDDPDLAHYGPQKAACRLEVEAAFGERALIVRPGLIVGPRDTTGRFSHWPWRALAGGAILVPDVPADEPIQVIDVRDLADLMVRLVEDERSGAYNVTGPAA